MKLSFDKSKGDKHSFGFNGMEMDDEVAGTGNSYTAPYWQYDPRLGRRWEQDPIEHPHQSAYSAMNNDPIYFKDPMGLKGSGNDPGFLETIWNAIRAAFSDKTLGPTGRLWGPKLESSSVTISNLRQLLGQVSTILRDGSDYLRMRGAYNIGSQRNRVTNVLNGGGPPSSTTRGKPNPPSNLSIGPPERRNVQVRGPQERGFSYERTFFELNTLSVANQYDFDKDGGGGFVTPFQRGTFNRSVEGGPAGSLDITGDVDFPNDADPGDVEGDGSNIYMDARVNARFSYTKVPIYQITKNQVKRIGWQHAPPPVAGALPWHKRSFSYLWNFYIEPGLGATLRQRFQNVTKSKVNRNATSPH